MVIIANKITSITLNTTEGCSLRCKYCFADINAGKKEGRNLSSETMKKVIDWLFADSTSGTALDLGTNSLGISFWGGEPFHNWPILKEAVLYANELSNSTGKKVNFSAATNMIELNKEKLDFIKKHKIGLTLSHDGIKEVHDSQRVFPEGRGSFDVLDSRLEDILENLDLQSAGIRLTITPKSIPYLYKSYEYFISKGFTRLHHCFAYEDNYSEDLLKEYKNQLIKIGKRCFIENRRGNEYEDKLLKDYLKLVEYLHKNNLDITNITAEQETQINKQFNFLRPCSCGLMFYSVSVEGAMFICHRFDKHGLDTPIESRPGFCGFIGDPLIISKELESIKSWDYSKEEKCKACPARFICRGGCFAAKYDMLGNVNDPLDAICAEHVATYEAAVEVYKLYTDTGLELSSKDLMFNKNTNQNTITQCTCNGTYVFPNYIGSNTEDYKNFDMTVLGMAQQVIDKYYRKELDKEVMSEREVVTTCK